MTITARSLPMNIHELSSPKTYDLLAGYGTELPMNGWAVISRETAPTAIADKGEKTPKPLGRTLILRCLQYSDIWFDSTFNGAQKDSIQSIQLSVDAVGLFALNNTLTREQAVALSPLNYKHAFGFEKPDVKKQDVIKPPVTEIGLDTWDADLKGVIAYTPVVPFKSIVEDSKFDFLASSSFGTYVAGDREALPQVLQETFLRKGYSDAHSQTLALLVGTVCHEMTKA